MTLDMKELKQNWMRLYINLMSLKSHNPIAKELLEKYQLKFALMNEDMMPFFDALEHRAN